MNLDKNSQTEKNPQLYETITFQRDLTDWSVISMALNLLLYHSAKSMADESALSDQHALDCFQTIIHFKQEIDMEVFNTLTNIPKQISA